MVDPLAQVVSLLQPKATKFKLVSGAGAWSVRREEQGQPFYCAILEGASHLAVDTREPVVLRAGDFVLIPAARGFAMSALDPALRTPVDIPSHPVPCAEVRHGEQSGPPDVRLLVGYCAFGSPDASLLVSLLPRFVHVRGEARLATLVQLVGEEYREQRPAREVILARLLEVLLIEALRSSAGMEASPGLLRGLADPRLAVAIRRMHEDPARAWTVTQLAKDAALSRSAFFERFNRAVGAAPMEYLLAWRMALAKNMLLRDEGNITEVAERVGYGSASAFSAAFARHVGVPPTQYARGAGESPPRSATE